MKYDDPLESDEEVDPRDPEDYIEEIDAMKPKPDLETEYRRAIRLTIRDESCTHHTYTRRRHNRIGRTTPQESGPSHTPHIR